MRMTKKITSLALAVMLVVSMLVVGAVSASAATQISTAKQLYAACWNGGTYELANDITLDYWGNNFVCADTTINGNGFTISASDTTGQTSGGSAVATQNFFKWYNNPHASLTLSKVTLDGKGIAICAVDNMCPSNAVTNNNDNDDCKVTMTNCTVKNFNGFSYVGAVYIFAYSDGEFNNCTFTGNKTQDPTSPYEGSDIWGGGGTTLTINGGSYADTIYGNASGSVASVVTIDGATVNEVALGATTQAGADLNVTDSSIGTVNVEDDTKTDITADADSAMVVQDFNGTVDTTKSSNVIMTAANLIAACAAGGNYVLGADITFDAVTTSALDANNPFAAEVKNDVVIEGNGKTIAQTVAGDMFRWVENSKASFTLSNATLKGNNVAGNALRTQAKVDANNNAACVVTLNDCTVQNFTGMSYTGAAYIFSHATGNFNNCTFTGNSTQNDASPYEGSDIWAGAAATININGGSFADTLFVNANSTGSAVANIDNATVGTLVLEEGNNGTGAVANVTNSTITDVKAYEDTLDGLNIDDASTVVNAPTNYDGRKYITNADELYDACAAGGNYILANDITLAGHSDYLVENDIDIDGNGKTLTASNDVASIFCWHNNANAKVTLKDAKLDGNNTAENAVYTPAYGLSNAQQNQNSDALVKFTNVEVCNFKGFQYVGAVYLFSHSKGEFTNCHFHDNSTPELDEDGFHGSDIWGGAATTNTISGGTFSDSVFVNGGSAHLTAKDNAQIASVEVFAMVDEAPSFITNEGATITETKAMNTKIDSYQKKTVKSTESTSEEGNDINTKGVRIIVKADKDFLDTCSDYGFVVAKYTGNKAQADLDFSVLNTTSGNGQKVISCKDSVNSGLGLGENYVTLAVNNMNSGDKVVARFYYVKNGTFYSTYKSYDGILATY